MQTILFWSRMTRLLWRRVVQLVQLTVAGPQVFFILYSYGLNRLDDISIRLKSSSRYKPHHNGPSIAVSPDSAYTLICTSVKET